MPRKIFVLNRYLLFSAAGLWQMSLLHEDCCPMRMYRRRKGNLKKEHASLFTFSKIYFSAHL
jgi:hypothetical protein